MKCIQALSGEVFRVTDEEAAQKVGRGYQFVPKREWKDSKKKENMEDRGT